MDVADELIECACYTSARRHPEVLGRIGSHGPAVPVDGPGVGRRRRVVRGVAVVVVGVVERCRAERGRRHGGGRAAACAGAPGDGHVVGRTQPVLGFAWRGSLRVAGPGRRGRGPGGAPGSASSDGGPGRDGGSVVKAPLRFVHGHLVVEPGRGCVGGLSGDAGRRRPRHPSTSARDVRPAAPSVDAATGGVDAAVGRGADRSAERDGGRAAGGGRTVGAQPAEPHRGPSVVAAVDAPSPLRCVAAGPVERRLARRRGGGVGRRVGNVRDRMVAVAGGGAASCGGGGPACCAAGRHWAVGVFGGGGPAGCRRGCCRARAMWRSTSHGSRVTAVAAAICSARSVTSASSRAVIATMRVGDASVAMCVATPTVPRRSTRVWCWPTCRRRGRSRAARRSSPTWSRRPRPAATAR